MTHADIGVRTATMADLPVIADIFSRAFRTLDFLPPLHTVAEDFAFWRDVVMVEQTVTVALSDGRIKGVMATVPGWITQLYVDPDFKGNGTGSALVRHAQETMTPIELWCFEPNRPARAFYERHGFEPTEFTDGAGNEAGCPDIRYVWTGPSTG